jgi:hypothetical protein
VLGFSLLLTRNGKGAQRGTTLTASARRLVSEPVNPRSTAHAQPVGAHEGSLRACEGGAIFAIAITYPVKDAQGVSYWDEKNC